MPPRKRVKVEEESDDEKNVDNSDNDEEEDNNSVSGSENGSESGSESGGDDDDDDDENGGNDSNDESSNSDDEDGDDDDDEEEEEEEEPPARGKRTRAAATASKKTTKKTTTVTKATKKTTAKGKTKQKTTTKASKSKKTKTEKSSSKSSSGKLKALKKSERLEEARKAYKWWEAPKLPAGTNWRYLEHPGIKFAPSYVRHNVPLYYNGQPVDLTDEQEEIATFFAAMPLDGPQLGNDKTRPVFEKNFFEDFKAALGEGHVIRSFDKLDFSEIRKHLDTQKSLKKAATDEEKLIKKAEKEADFLRYGYALIDGRLEKMGNYNMEPPSLFRGRGEHPKTGRLKTRCFSEQVALNLSEDSCVPICPLPGHAWQSVRHDPAVTWLCSWTENVQNQNKYVMLSASSSFKGKSDLDKYNKAIKLKTCIHKVRADYTAKIRQTKDRSDRQLGTAMWVIDVLALRVGGEKGEDEADTVGCCSLRREHLRFNADPESYEIELEFLGKDSMLFKQTINFAQHGELGKAVYGCLRDFCANKRPDQDVFETLTPPILNKHLNSLMKGLTAKVFRTYNASVTLEKELPSAEDLEGLPVQEKVVRYNAANRQVAILCNHQRTVSKATETMFENLNEKLQILKDQRVELVKWKELAQKNKVKSIPLKDDDNDVVERIQTQLQNAQQRKEKAKTTDEKLAAAEALEVAKQAAKADLRRRNMEKHKFKTTPSVDSLANRIEKWTEDIRKLEVDIRNRDENKEVALGTSKINYMDPRISVAWCKRCEVPIDKVFAKTLRDKFNWAMAVPPDWKFE